MAVKRHDERLVILDKELLFHDKWDLVGFMVVSLREIPDIEASVSVATHTCTVI